MRLLDAGGFEIVQDHPGEVLRFAVAELGLCDISGPIIGPVDEFVVLVHAQQAVGREAFHRERSSDADLLVILVGLVIEVFVVGFGGDGGVDLALARDPRHPQFLMQWGGLRRPLVR